MRLFLAISLAPQQRQELRKLQQRLRPHLQGVKWVSPEGMHITLKFLGEVERGLLPEIAPAVARAVASVGRYNFKLAALGVFPNPARARVIWSGMGKGKAETKVLVSRLEEELAPLGFPKETRTAIPHLTLGRIRGSLPRNNLTRIMEEERKFLTSLGIADKITLYQSCLSGQGARYEPLFEKYLLENAGN